MATKQDVMDYYDDLISRLPDFMKTRELEKRIYDARAADIARVEAENGKVAP